MSTCPLCKTGAKQSVRDSRDLGGGIRYRRRKCDACSQTYSTVEVIWSNPRGGLPRAVKAMIDHQMDLEDWVQHGGLDAPSV
jgi:hypothetical protein